MIVIMIIVLSERMNEYCSLVLSLIQFIHNNMTRTIRTRLRLVRERDMNRIKIGMGGMN